MQTACPLTLFSLRGSGGVIFADALEGVDGSRGEDGGVDGGVVPSLARFSEFS